jgi:hypothetical protein
VGGILGGSSGIRCDNYFWNLDNIAIIKSPLTFANLSHLIKGNLTIMDEGKALSVRTKFLTKVDEWRKSKEPINCVFPNAAYVGEVVLEGIKINSLNVEANGKHQCPKIKLINCDLKRNIEVNFSHVNLTIVDCQTNSATALKYRDNTSNNKLNFKGEGELSILLRPTQNFEFLKIEGNKKLNLRLELSGGRSSSYFAKNAVFKGVTFTTFSANNIDFNGNIHLSDCLFDGSFEIDRKSSFGSKVVWPKYKSFKSFNFETIGSYRRLKQQAQERANKHDAQLFWALELKNQRILMGLRDAPFKKTLSLCYDLISCYGQSAGRAIAVLAGIIITFGNSLALVNSEAPLFQFDTQVDLQLWVESIIYSLKQIAVPFSSLKTDASPTLKIASSLFTIVSLGVVTLSILAIRGSFKQ